MLSNPVYKLCNAGGGGRDLEARPQERFWRVFHQEFLVKAKIRYFGSFILLCGNWTVSEIFLNTALFERGFIPIVTMNSIFLNSLIAKAKMPRIPSANAGLISTGNLFGRTLKISW